MPPSSADRNTALMVTSLTKGCARLASKSFMELGRSDQRPRRAIFFLHLLSPATLEGVNGFSGDGRLQADPEFPREGLRIY